MSAPGPSCAEVISRLGAGDEVGVLHRLAHVATTERGSLERRLATREEGDPAPHEGDHGEVLLRVSLPLVAYGGRAAHAAVAKAVSHLARAMAGERHGGRADGLRMAEPVVGRLVWALAAQAVATRRPDFLAVLPRVWVPSAADARPAGALRERSLRHPVALGESARRAFEHYRGWLAGRAYLGECSPYLAADVDEAIATADLLLALALVRSGGECLSMGAERGPALRLAYLLAAHDAAIAAFLELPAPGVREEVIRLWDRLRAPPDGRRRPQLATLLAGGPHGA